MQLTLLFTLLAVALCDFPSLYYSRIIAQSTEAPVSINNTSDPIGARMLTANYGYAPIYTSADRTTLFNNATTHYRNQFNLNITNDLWNPVTQRWELPGVGYMFQTYFGGCSNTQSQSNVTYKVNFDTDNLAKGSIFEWCVINPSMSFIFTSTGTISGGAAAGQNYTAFGNFVSYAWINTVRNGYDWSKSWNRQTAVGYTKDLGNIVRTSEGFSSFLIKVYRYEPGFGTGYTNDATTTAVVDGVPTTRISTTWYFPKNQ